MEIALVKRTIKKIENTSRCTCWLFLFVVYAIKIKVKQWLFGSYITQLYGTLGLLGEKHYSIRYTCVCVAFLLKLKNKTVTILHAM